MRRFENLKYPFIGLIKSVAMRWAGHVPRTDELWSVSNPSRQSGDYVLFSLSVINAAFCIYRFRMFFGVNRDCFLKQH
jgi:hypothetical protein